jgi:hypothetical protein
MNSEYKEEAVSSQQSRFAQMQIQMQGRELHGC